MRNLAEGPALLLGRLLIALLYLPSGLHKLGAAAATIGAIAADGLPLPGVGYTVAIAVEIPIALLFLFGLWTRPLAAILAIYTLAAAAFFHNHLVDPAQAVNFFKNLAITGGLMFAVAHGGGAWSLDRGLRRR